MTDHSEEFLAQYKETYGRYDKKADHTRCASSVYDDMWSGARQCSRKNGHGPHGAWCKQHDPVAVKARDVARRAQWKAEYDAKDRKRKFEAECIAAIKSIAAGHNDPRGLAQSLIDEGEK